MSRRRDNCASSEGGIIRGYVAWAQLRESGETGRRAGLRIQWAKSPWGFDSPLSHQHRDLLRGRIADLRGPARSPLPGYLTRFNLVGVGVQPLARVNISRVLLDDDHPRAAADAQLPGEGRRLCATAQARAAVAAVLPPAVGECWRVPSRCSCSGRPPLERSRGRRSRTREHRRCRPLSRSFAAGP